MIYPGQNDYYDVDIFNGNFRELEGKLNEALEKVTLRKAMIYYGYPIAINNVWSVEAACNIYKNYSLVVFGDKYNRPDHEVYGETVEIFSRLKEISPDTKIVGYVPIGCITGFEDSNLTMLQLKERVDLWRNIGADGIFLDEFGYDYRVTRARQNEIITYIKSLGMFVFVNAWEIRYIFSEEPVVLDWLDNFSPNPEGLPCLLDKNDYSLFENLFHSVEHDDVKDSWVLRCATPWRIDDAYGYYTRDVGNGKTYFEMYGTQMVALDAIPSSMDATSKNILQTISVFGSRILNVPYLALGDEFWGSSGYYNDWDLPEIDMSESVSKGLHAVTIENKSYTTAEGKTEEFPYRWSAAINGNRYTVVYDIPDPEYETWADGMRYVTVNDSVVENAWMSIYETKTAVDRAKAASEEAVKMAEKIKTKVENALPTLTNAEEEMKKIAADAEKKISDAEKTLDTGMKDLEMLTAGFQYKERQW